MSNRKITMQPVKYGVTTLGGGQTQAGVSYPGGLDQVTPTLRLQPGTARDGVNFECMQSGGYGRIAGYERVDGRLEPSSASFQIVQVDGFINTPIAGQVVTQDVTGATGTVIRAVEGTQLLTYIADPEGGFVADPQGGFVGGVPLTTSSFSYIVITKVAGSFDPIHDVFAAATPAFSLGSGAFGLNAMGGSGGMIVGTAIQQTAIIDSKTAAIYLAAAADVYRADIGPVPGSGPVLGVVHMVFGGADNVYAFRANAAGTSVAIYKASPAGWVLVPFFNLVNWTAGVTQPHDGDTLTQGGVTATIQRVMWQSGAFAAGPGNTAAGAFVVTNPAGGNFAAGAATTSSGGAITLSGVQTSIRLVANGSNRFEFIKCNFSGQLITRRIYGCDGVNPPFEFDGTSLAPIDTGLSPNMPSHIYFHKNYLFISQRSSLIYCGVGTPFKWTAIDGGGEIATGDTVTGMVTLPGSQTTATLAVFLASNTSFLYGTDPSTFNYVTFNSGIGALPYTAQNLFDTFVLDSLGVITLRTTLNWGNFLPTALTKNMLPFILQERDKVTASCIFREKSSYRLFFSDGYGLWLTMINQQYLGGLPVLFPNPVFCIDEDTDSLHGEVVYFGSSDGLGYVYQLERGTSFDGATISAFIEMSWDPLKSPRILKRFRAGSVEVQGGAYAEFSFGYQLGYNSSLVGQPPATTLATGFAAAPHWDQFVWDNFIWDGSTLLPTDVDMTGTAETVRAIFRTGTNYIGAFTLDSIIYHYSMGRGMRV